jgi:uncharacterized protein YlxW (UPF0749 family)
MTHQAAQLERLAQDLSARAEQLREEAKALEDQTSEIDAEHKEFLADMQEPVNRLRNLAGLEDLDLENDLEPVPAD